MHERFVYSRSCNTIKESLSVAPKICVSGALHYNDENLKYPWDTGPKMSSYKAFILRPECGGYQKARPDALIKD